MGRREGGEGRKQEPVGEENRKRAQALESRMEKAKEEDGEDGWEFWGRVYEDPGLRSEIASGSGGEPTLSEVLSGEALQKTRVLIHNLPQPACETEIKDLLETELGPTTVMKVYITRASKAIAEFYYSNHAARAIAAFHGRVLRGQRLVVVASGPRFQPLPSLEERGLGWGESLRAKDEERAEQGLTLADLVRTLVTWIRDDGPIRIGDLRISALVKERGSLSLKHHLAAWPQGAFRARPELRLVGPFLCLPGGRNEDVATLLCSRLGGLEGASGCWKEPWEPFPLSQVRSLGGAVEYLAALTGKFGPLWVWDPRVCVVLGQWEGAAQLPRQAFLDLAAEWGLMLVGDTVYNLCLAPHRQALLATLAPLPRPKALALGHLPHLPSALAALNPTPLAAFKPSFPSILPDRIFV